MTEYALGNGIALAVASGISNIPMETLINNPAALKYHESLISFGVGVTSLMGLLWGSIAVVGRLKQQHHYKTVLLSGS